MSSVRSMVGMVRVDDAEPVVAQLQVTQETQIVRSRGPRPDPGWTHVDEAGHFHSRSADGSTPTLRTEEIAMPCDGSCGGVCDGEGYSVTRWSCRICRAEITPGVIEGEYSVPVETGAYWEVAAEVPWTGHDEVTVRFTAEGLAEEWFGVAAPADGEMTMGPEGARGRVVLHGVSHLGTRERTLASR